MLRSEGVWIPQLLQEEKMLFEATFFLSKLFVYFLEVAYSFGWFVY